MESERLLNAELYIETPEMACLHMCIILFLLFASHFLIIICKTLFNVVFTQRFFIYVESAPLCDIAGRRISTFYRN